MRLILAALASAALITTAATPAFAHHNISHSMATRSAAEQRAAPAMPMQERMDAMPCAAHEGVGVVTAIRAEEVTLRHEPIASLNWPAMSMRFRAQSPALLEGLAVGDQVRFRLQTAGDGYVIDQIVKQ